jgi:hypothetical protein
MLSSGELELTEENVAMVQLQKAFEYAMEALHGKKRYPVEKLVIKDMDKLSSRDIINKIVDGIDAYNEKHRNLFEN